MEEFPKKEKRKIRIKRERNETLKYKEILEMNQIGHYCALPKDKAQDYENEETLTTQGLISQRLDFLIEKLNPNTLYFICKYDIFFHHKKENQESINKLIYNAQSNDVLIQNIKEMLKSVDSIEKSDTVWDNVYIQNSHEYECCVLKDNTGNNICGLHKTLSKINENYDIYGDFINTDEFLNYKRVSFGQDSVFTFTTRLYEVEPDQENENTFRDLQLKLQEDVRARFEVLDSVLTSINNSGSNTTNDDSQKNVIIERFSNLIHREDGKPIEYEDIVEYFKNQYEKDKKTLSKQLAEYDDTFQVMEKRFIDTIATQEKFFETKVSDVTSANLKLEEALKKKATDINTTIALFNSKIKSLEISHATSTSVTKNELDALKHANRQEELKLSGMTLEITRLKELLKLSSESETELLKKNLEQYKTLSDSTEQLRSLYETQLGDKDVELLKLVSALEEINVLNASLGTELTQKSLENNVLREENVAVDLENQHLNSTKNELEKEITKLNLEIATLRATGDENSNNKITELTTELNDQKRKLDDIRAKLVSRNEEFEREKMEGSEKDILLIALEKTREELVEEVEDLKEQLSRLSNSQNDVSTELTAKIVQAEQKLNDVTNSITESKKEIEDITAAKNIEIAALNEQLEKIKREGTSESALSKQLREQILEKQKEIEEKYTLLQDVNREKESLKKSLDTAITHRLTVLNDYIRSNLKEIVLRYENNEKAANDEREERETEAQRRRDEQTTLEQNIQKIEDEHDAERLRQDQLNNNTKVLQQKGKEYEALQIKKKAMTASLLNYLQKSLGIINTEEHYTKNEIETLITEISHLYLSENGLYYKMSSLEPDYFYTGFQRIREFVNNDVSVWDGSSAGFFPFFYQNTYIKQNLQFPLDNFDIIKDTPIYRDVNLINELIKSLRPTKHFLVDQDNFVFFYEYITKMKVAMESLNKDADFNDDDPNYLFGYIHKILSKILEKFKEISVRYNELKFLSKQTIEKICSYNLNQISKNFLLTYVKFTDKKNGVKFITPNNETITTNPRYKFLLTGEEKGKYNQMDLHYSVQRTEINSNTDNTYVNGKSIPKIVDKFRYGKFTNIFNCTESNKEIANKMKTEITDQVIGRGPDERIDPKNKRPVFIIGYGASGSGKTSALVYLRKKEGPGEQGIFLVLCNTIGNDLYKNKDVAVTMNIKILETGTKVDSPGEKETYDSREITATYNRENFQFELEKYSHSTKPIHSYRFESEKKESRTIENLGDALIDAIDDDRVVKPTPNNPNSSRTHCIAYTTITQGNEKYVLVLGDFAGVENKFDCNNLSMIKAFANIKGYKTDEYESLKKTKQTDSYLGGGNHPFDKKMFAFDSEYDTNVKNERHPNVFDKDDILKFITSSANFKTIANDKKTLNEISDNISNIDPNNFITELKIVLKGINERLIHPPDPTIYSTYGKDESKKSQTSMSTFIQNKLKEYPIELYEDDLVNAVLKERKKNKIATAKDFITFFSDLNEDLNLLSNVTDLANAYKNNLQMSAKRLTYYGNVQWESGLTQMALDVLYNQDNNSFKGKLLFKTRGELLIKWLQNFVQLPNPTRIHAENKAIDKSNISNIRDTIINIMKNKGFKYYIPFINNNNSELSLLDNTIALDQKNSNIKELKEELTVLGKELESIGDLTAPSVKAGLSICKRRGADGEYINNSLKELRDDVNLIMSIKGETLVSYCPNFVPTCYDDYTGKNTDPSKLFMIEQPTSKNFIENGLMESVFKMYSQENPNVTVDEFSKKIIISLFGVFNITREIKEKENTIVNIIPSVHYTNVMNLTKNNDNLNEKVTTFITSLKQCFKQDNDPFDYDDYDYNLSLYNQCKITLNDKISSLSEIIQGKAFFQNSTPEEKVAAVQKIIEFCNNMNAASYIGTLEYMDKLSRLNTTQMICKPTSELVGSVYNTVTGKIDTPEKSERSLELHRLGQQSGI